MFKSTLLILTFLFFYNTSGAEHDNIDNSRLSHQIVAGTDRSNTILQYNYIFPGSWNLRAGLFSNLNPDILSYHLNTGVTYSFFREGDHPKVYAGLDMTMLNYYGNDDPIFGAGPVVGIRYEVTNRFSVSLEQGATIYRREVAVDEYGIRWTWHRQTALMLGWKFGGNLN